jgi:hypothetical protein
MTEWFSSGRLEVSGFYLNESGWLVNLTTTDPLEIEDWCCDNIRDDWEIRKMQMRSRSKDQEWYVTIKLDSDRDYMLLKLRWQNV